MDLSIVICTYNRAYFLRLGLEAIISQLNLVTDFSIELLVVDNNSSDTTDSLVSEFKERYQNLSILYFLEQQQGLSFSRNRSVKEANGEFIAFLDDDAVVNKNWLPSLIDAIGNTKAHVYGGPIYPNFEIPCPEWIDETYFIRSFNNGDGYLSSLASKSGFSGGNMCFKKDIFDSIGLFNTSLGMNGNTLGLGEETDLFDRLFHSTYKTKLYNIDLMSISHFEGRAKLDRLYLKERIHLSGLQFSHRFRSQYKVGGTLLVFMKILKQFLSSLVFLIQRPFYPSSKFKFLKCIWLIKGLWKGVFIS
jgi:glycosyltransferase involved in cell wall biosynthesis